MDYRSREAARKRRWREEHQAESRASSRRVYEKIRSIIETAKDVPCARCRERFPVVCMDFHHRDPREKLFPIGSNTRGVPKLRAEIAKCDVLCANCHRIVTYEEANQE